MNDLYLTDEEIYGKEPTDTERSLMEENNKLKIKLINNDEELEISQYTINRMSDIIDKAINTNIRKTRMIANPSIIKIYREELLTLRALEKEIQDYNNRLVKILS